MVVFELLSILIAFVFVQLAAYVGALRALEVYHDPNQDSIFLGSDTGPRKPRRGRGFDEKN